MHPLVLFPCLDDICAETFIRGEFYHGGHTGFVKTHTSLSLGSCQRTRRGRVALDLSPSALLVVLLPPTGLTQSPAPVELGSREYNRRP